MHSTNLFAYKKILYSTNNRLFVNSQLIPPNKQFFVGIKWIVAAIWPPFNFCCQISDFFQFCNLEWGFVLKYRCLVCFMNWVLLFASLENVNILCQIIDSNIFYLKSFDREKRDFLKKVPGGRKCNQSPYPVSYTHLK